MQNTIERFLNPSIEPETFIDEGRRIGRALLRSFYAMKMQLAFAMPC